MDFLNRFFKAFGYGAMSAIIITLPFFLVGLAKAIVRLKNPEECWQVRKAKELGHVITAHVAKYYVPRDPREEARFGALYKYEWEGKTYRKQLFGNSELPYEETLYFVKNPRKATTARSWASKMPKVKRLFLAVFILVFIIMYFG